MVDADTLLRSAALLRASARRAREKAANYLAQQEEYARDYEADAIEMERRADALRLSSGATDE